MSKEMDCKLISTRKNVKNILTKDWLSRKKTSWKLVPISEFYLYKLRDDKVNEDDEHLCVVKAPYRGEIHADYNFDKIVGLHERFSLLEYLFSKYTGKIAVCGGSLIRIFSKDSHGYESNYDVDIFFYNTNIDEANMILEDCINIMAQNTVEFTIERRDHVINFIDTTVHGGYGKNGRFYQFVLRIYPTLDSIIGGFDLGPSMLAYDGRMLYGTELAAWSIVNKCIIIDTTRRSVSFTQRLIKYRNLGFNVIFPGLTESTYENNVVSHEEMKAKFKKFILENKLGIWVDTCERCSDRQHSEILTDKVTYRPGITLNKELRIDDDNYIEKQQKWSLHDMTEDMIISEDILKQYSDYGVYHHFPDRDKTDIIATLLRCNNRSGIFITKSFNKATKKFSIDDFRNMIYKPVILTYTEAAIARQKYDERLQKYIELVINNEREIVDNRQRISLFAEYLTEFERFAKEQSRKMQYRSDTRPSFSLIKLDIKSEECTDPHYKKIIERHNEFRNKMYEIMSKRMEDNLIKWTEEMTGIKWITKNPMRQWTSSINPIMEDPRMFYGKLYVPFYVGINKDVELTLRLLRKRKNLFSLNVNKDVFSIILLKLINLELDDQ